MNPISDGRYSGMNANQSELFNATVVENPRSANAGEVLETILNENQAVPIEGRYVHGVTRRNVAVVLVWAGNGGPKAFTAKIWGELKAELAQMGVRTVIVYAEQDLVGGGAYEFRQINSDGEPIGE
jgi:hypothetical protein